MTMVNGVLHQSENPGSAGLGAHSPSDFDELDALEGVYVEDGDPAL